jgi:peptide/nickel transport system permease protein
MAKLVLRKLLEALLILPGIVTLLFLIFSLLGDPARMLAGQRADLGTLQSIRAELGLDKPLPQQYLHYLNDVSPVGWLSAAQQAGGNYRFVKVIALADGALVVKLPYLRRSYQNQRPVLDVYAERLPPTLLLALGSIVLAGVLGIGLGIVAALHRDRWPDRVLSLLAQAGISAPSFFVAVLFAWFFAIYLYPVTGLNLTGYVRTENVLTDGYTYQWRNLLLPTLTLGIRPLSILFQLTRNGMIEALGADYIRTARAKGLRLPRIVLVHALPNAAGPLVTSLSGWFASLLTGAFFVEYIFDWPGVGKLTVDALYTNDYPVVLGSCLFTGIIFLLVNLAVEISYPLIDPRVRTT